MILYFNKNGQLLEQLEYGAVARVGMTKFQIFAYFEGIDLSNYDSALIRFKRPDLNGSEYPDLFMVQASINYDDNIEGSDYFDAADNPYIGYLFDFNTITDGSGNVVLLDTPGQWEASITLVSTNGGFNVTGLVRFTVEGSVSEADDEETELQYSTISNNIALAVAQKISKSDENYMRYNANLGTNAAQGNLLASFYPVGCLVFDGNTNAIYIIDTVTPKDETHEYATISKVWQIDNPAEVDSALSNTSANPVENQVVTRALQNVREVAEGKCKSVVIDYAFVALTETNFNDTTVKKENGDVIATWAEYQAYISGRSLGNSLFDSQNNTINVNKSDYYFLTYDYGSLSWTVYLDFNTFNTGDVLFVVEANVPDRWFNVYSSAISFYNLDTKVDLTGFVKTDDTSQTIAGQKTFSGVLKCTSKFNLVGRFNHDLIPDGNNSYNIGSQAEALANVFTKGLKDGNNGTYGIKLPNTTGWSADKTLATTDQLTGVAYKHNIAATLVSSVLGINVNLYFSYVSNSGTQISSFSDLISDLDKWKYNACSFRNLNNDSLYDICVLMSALVSGSDFLIGYNKTGSDGTATIIYGTIAESTITDSVTTL